MSSEESGRAQRVVASCVGAWHLRRRRVHARPVRVRPSRSWPARSWAARVALVLLVMGVGVGAVPLGVGASPAAAADDAAAILVQVNQARAAVGAPPLRLSSAMSAVATRWSTHLADSGTCPGGLAHNPSFSQQIPRGWSAAGENVACNTSADALGLEAQWMSSAPHRANILNPAYTDIGIGIVVSGRTAWGTQNFGTYSSAPAPEPALLPAPAPPAPTPTPTPTPSPSPSASPTPAPTLTSAPDAVPDSVPAAAATDASSAAARSTAGGADAAGLLGVAGSLTLGVLAVAGHRRERT